MNGIAFLALFAAFVFFYSVVIQVFTVLFRLTGLTREKARFQVISMLTNSGFTTNESELLVSARLRRRLAQITMLTGYCCTVLILAIAVNVFLSLSRAEVESMLLPLLLLILLLVAVFWISRLPKIQERFDLLIERVGNRLMFGKTSNILVLIDMYRQKAMVEVILDHLPAFLVATPLADSGLREQDIQLLFVKRGGEPVEPIDGNIILKQGDTCMLFGNYKNIRAVFEHSS